MKISLVATVILGSFMIAADVFAGTPSAQGAGTLVPQHDLGCPAPESLTSKYTPVDLYAAMTDCARRDKYRESAFLFAMAGVYGRYDSYRVKEEANHRAATSLRLWAIDAIGEEKYDAFQAGLQDTLKTPESLAEVCKTILGYGPPAYRPDYMLRFGDASGEGGLVENFDGKAALKEALASYLRCQNL